MINKGFLASHLRKNSGSYKRSSIITNTILLIGIAVLIFSLLFLIISLDKADSIIMIWLPFMISGVVLVFVSQVINHFHKNRIRGKQKRLIQHHL
jgi:hypothetical protein